MNYGGVGTSLPRILEANAIVKYDIRIRSATARLERS